MDLGCNEGGVQLKVNAVETLKFDSCSEDILDGEGCKEITIVVVFHSYNTLFNYTVMILRTEWLHKTKANSQMHKAAMWEGEVEKADSMSQSRG